MSRDLLIAHLLALRSQAQAMATQCTALLAAVHEADEAAAPSAPEFPDTFDTSPPPTPGA